jgi:hypothetical protein
MLRAEVYARALRAIQNAKRAEVFSLVRNVFSEPPLSNILETSRALTAKKHPIWSSLLAWLCYQVSVNDLHGVGALRAPVSHN